jgi:hypothetical protein
MIDPVFVYVSAWALVLGLCSLGLVSNVVEVSGIDLLVILIEVLGIILISTFCFGENGVELKAKKTGYIF